MNKLINRISPETSENRILHAGFSIILMSEEITQTLSGLSSDMIIFILSGSITIYSTKEEKKTIGEQYMIFLRSFENYTYDITLGSKIIIFFFDSYSCCRWRGYRCRSIRRLIRDETVCFAERLSGSRKLSYEYLSDRRVL